MVTGVRRALGRHALAATATVAVLVLSAACSGDSSSGDPESEPTGGAAGPGTTASAAAEADHSVKPPGPRGPGLVAPSDIQVVAGSTLDPDVVKAIDKLDDVSVLQVSLSQTVIENEALTVVAADPGAYRTFTKSAEFQEAWDRMAGGELALKSRLKHKVATDDNFLRLGTATDAPSVHIGAYVKQQPLVDVAVNQTWVEALGMAKDNALLVRTGPRAPAKVAEEIRAIVGDGAAVTLVDLATRRGLQPGAAQFVVVTGSVADAVGVFRYTVLSGGRIAPDPAWVREHIATEVVPILGSVTCNKLIFPQLKAALKDILERGLADKIHPGEYAGCYYPRFIAGSSTLSNHAFGLALDLNVPGNQRGTVGEMDRGVVDVFKKWGFAWGGDWGYTDPMHFEMAELVGPGGTTAP
jgi:hypothetical protein